MDLHHASSIEMNSSFEAGCHCVAAHACQRGICCGFVKTQQIPQMLQMDEDALHTHWPATACTATVDCICAAKKDAAVPEDTPLPLGGVPLT
jgi:hypothetical protein